MSYVRYEYEIFKFRTPRHYVAQVAEINHETGDCQTWCYTAEDLRILVTRGHEPIRITLVHGTSRAWFDAMVQPQERMIDLYFEADSRQQADSVFEDSVRASA